jgi:hypothetical protein
MEDIMEKIFLLSYHMGFNYNDILNLNKRESEFYLERLIEQKKREIPK